MLLVHGLVQSQASCAHTRYPTQYSRLLTDMYSARAGWWHASSSLAWFQIQVQDRSQPSSDDDAVVEMTGSDFRIVTVDKGLMKAEPWLNHQPFGQMPYLLDDENGLEVFESRALIRCR